MKSLIAGVKFAAFFALTFGSYSLWFLAPYLRSDEDRVWLREFIFGIWARGFVALANCKIKVTGKPPKQPFLLVTNHVSYFDVAVLRSVVKCVFVAKSEIEEWQLAGKMVRDMGMIFVNRQKRRDIPRAGKEIVEALERGEGVVIFPEGTTSNGEKILPFKSSFLEFAAARDMPVHYASIHYRTPPDEPPASEAVCWWRDEHYFGAHLFDMFKLREFECTLIFGDAPVHSPNRKELTNRLYKAINQQLFSGN